MRFKLGKYESLFPLFDEAQYGSKKEQLAAQKKRELEIAEAEAEREYVMKNWQKIKNK